jgi:hypothetical protein
MAAAVKNGLQVGEMLGGISHGTNVRWQQG